jgi:uncharacterized repeat protein (TIGR01451 family)
MTAHHKADGKPLGLALVGVAVLLALAWVPRVMALRLDRPPHQTVPTLTPSVQPVSPSPPPPVTEPPAPPTLPPATPVLAEPSPLPPPGSGASGALRMAVDRVAVRPGDIVTYTLLLANEGEVAVRGVTITDELDRALSLLQVKATQGSAFVDGQRLTVQIGTLQSRASVQLALRARVSWQAPAGRVIVNQARASWGQEVLQSNAAPVALPPAVLPATGAAQPDPP